MQFIIGVKSTLCILYFKQTQSQCLNMGKVRSDNFPIIMECYYPGLGQCFIVGIWIVNKFGIQMVESSSLVKWFAIQMFIIQVVRTIWLPTIWIPNIWIKNY